MYFAVNTCIFMGNVVFYYWVEELGLGDDARLIKLTEVSSATSGLGWVGTVNKEWRMEEKGNEEDND